MPLDEMPEGEYRKLMRIANLEAHKRAHYVLLNSLSIVLSELPSPLASTLLERLRQLCRQSLETIGNEHTATAELVETFFFAVSQSLNP